MRPLIVPIVAYCEARAGLIILSAINVVSSSKVWIVTIIFLLWVVMTGSKLVRAMTLSMPAMATMLSMAVSAVITLPAVLVMTRSFLQVLILAFGLIWNRVLARVERPLTTHMSVSRRWLERTITTRWAAMLVITVSKVAVAVISSKGAAAMIR